MMDSNSIIEYDERNNDCCCPRDSNEEIERRDRTKRSNEEIERRDRTKRSNEEIERGGDRLSSYRIAVTRPLSPAARQKLEPYAEMNIWEQPGPMPRSLLLEWLRDADGLFSSGDVRVDEELLAAAPRLKVISQSSVGYDNVDVEACTRRGVPFGNTPGVLVEATADLTFGMLLTSARRIHEGWEWVRSGRWTEEASFPFGVDLCGKTLGIVGMGDIGAAVARRAQASCMRVIYHNRTRRSDEAAVGAVYAEFGELLETSDFIVVLVPLNAATQGMFGQAEFARMKPTAYFVNASRGKVVQTEALVAALLERRIAYAALDVTDPEPLPAGHPLLALPNVLITPHIGSATHETRTRMAELAADNLIAGLQGRRLPACVNPEVFGER
jgi:glyoxylate reductase